MNFLNLLLLKDFERGKFEAAGRKARSEKATTKFSYTHDELQTMFAAGVFDGAAVVKDSSSDDDSDANGDDITQPSPSLDTPADDIVLNLRKTKLNFNDIFRECPVEEQLEFGDLKGDEYFIEEDFRGVDIFDNFNACENLLEEAKDMEVDSDEDGAEFTEGPSKSLCSKYCVAFCLSSCPMGNPVLTGPLYPLLVLQGDKVEYSRGER